MSRRHGRGEGRGCRFLRRRATGSIAAVSDPLDHSLARLGRWRRCQRGLDALLPAAAVGLGVAATAVMVVRLGLPALAWAAWPLAAAGGLAPLLVLPRALRRRDDGAELAGRLDLQLGANGVAMALAAAPAAQRDAGWLARLRRPLEAWEPPRLAWAAGRPTLAALAILALALALPQAVPRRVTASPTAGLFAHASERLGELAAARLLPAEQAEELQKRLESLKAEAARSGMDQATWEGLARLEQDLGSAGQQAGKRLAEALAAAEHAATPPEASRTPEAAAQAASAMAQQLAELAAQAPGLVPTLPAAADAAALRAALQQAAAQGKLSAEQLAALEKLGLQPAGGAAAALSDREARDLARKLSDELAKRAAALGSDGAEALALALAEGQGRGDPSRGPGHAQHPQVAAERFPVGEVEGLAPGSRLNPDGSVTLAEQVREPDVDAATAEAGRRAVAQRFDPAAADARRAATAPRHRATVQRYFAGE
jgi:hypothetical protein